MDAATAVPNLPEQGLWPSIREALRGSHQDYTSGNLNRAILLLAIPMVLEMVLESSVRGGGRLLRGAPGRQCGGDRWT